MGLKNIYNLMDINGENKACTFIITSFDFDAAMLYTTTMIFHTEMKCLKQPKCSK